MVLRRIFAEDSGDAVLDHLFRINGCCGLRRSKTGRGFGGRCQGRRSFPRWERRGRRHVGCGCRFLGRLRGWWRRRIIAIQRDGEFALLFRFGQHLGLFRSDGDGHDIGIGFGTRGGNGMIDRQHQDIAHDSRAFRSLFAGHFHQHHIDLATGKNEFATGCADGAARADQQRIGSGAGRQGRRSRFSRGQRRLDLVHQRGDGLSDHFRVGQPFIQRFELNDHVRFGRGGECRNRHHRCQRREYHPGAHGNTPSEKPLAT